MHSPSKAAVLAAAAMIAAPIRGQAQVKPNPQGAWGSQTKGAQSRHI